MDALLGIFLLANIEVEVFANKVVVRRVERSYSQRRSWAESFPDNYRQCTVGGGRAEIRLEWDDSLVCTYIYAPDKWHFVPTKPGGCDTVRATESNIFCTFWFDWEEF